MCGVLYAHDDFLNEKSFKKSLHIIKHRGPDYQSFNFIDKYSMLGHVRLSIIDCTENSNQPFEYNNNQISFNGEIYNYLELRKKLIGEGIKFYSDGDTEVLLKGLIHYGEEFISMLRGMWAFIWINENVI